MNINIRSVFEQTGLTQTFDISLPKTDMIIGNLTDVDFADDIKVTAVAQNHAGIITLSVSINYGVNEVCDRCCTPFVRQYQHDKLFTVVKHIYSTDDLDDYIESPDGDLDITDITAAEIILERPAKILCNADCTGVPGFEVEIE
ncbi:MAG: hypothetical protein LBM87_03805 [Ruminococcus sp.]|jgi:uncharacterized metal-binding protein YceD (DUF177 family)|nr:hypothetical protein [Ruminococcus sp.]